MSLSFSFRFQTVNKNRYLHTENDENTLFTDESKKSPLIWPLVTPSYPLVTL